VQLLDNRTQHCRTPTMHPDLRITLPGFAQPERIWVCTTSGPVNEPDSVLAPRGPAS